MAASEKFLSQVCHKILAIFIWLICFDPSNFKVTFHSLPRLLKKWSSVSQISGFFQALDWLRYLWSVTHVWHSFYMYLTALSIQSGASQLINLRGGRWSTSRETQRNLSLQSVHLCLCLPFPDHLRINCWKCNMSMVMVEYIYGISNIRDNCYELDMRILYKGSHKNIDLVYYRFCSLDELPSIMSLNQLTRSTCYLLSSHTYNYMFISIYQVTLINWDTTDCL